MTRTTAEAVQLPFDEAVDYFRQKTNMPSAHWTAVMDEAHARAFAVAGATKKALIEDFRQAVDKAISKGTGFGEFKRDFDDIVKRHGWVHHGHPQWRARVIYESNMSTAYAAGRYAQMTRPETLEAFPYWQFVHTPVAHPRIMHLAWNGLTLRADDGWWDTHYPPKGWGCRCIVSVVSEGGLRRMGKTKPDTAPETKWREYINKTTGIVTRVPEGVDPGWVGNPGKIWKEGRRAPLRAEAVTPLAPARVPLPHDLRRFRSADAAEKTLAPLMKPWADTLTDEESDALDDYKGMYARKMNAVLRGEVEEPAATKRAAALRNALERAEAPLTLELWRSVRGEELRHLAALQEGETLQRQDFMSTTVLRAIAEKLQGSDGAIVRILLNQGTRGAAYVHPFPRYRFPQAEVLLNAGMRFTMIGSDDATITLRAEGSDDDHR